MIKKIINVVVISLTGLMIFVGCSFSDKSNQSNVDNTTNVENNKSIEERQVMNTVDFENLLSSQPVSVINTEYVVQDESFKALYPDLLTVSIKNNTDQDIKNAVVSFVAWDENNLPVKIEGQFDFSDTTYVKKVNFSDINLVAGGTLKNAVVSFVAWDENNLPVKIEGQFDFSDTTYVKKVNFSDINLVAGGTFENAVVSFVAWDENNLPVKIEGQFDFSDTTYVKKVNFSDINLVAGGTFDEKSGLALSENSKIKTFKVIVESYETFDGATWKNPYYDEFCTLYEGKKLTDDMSVEVKLENDTNIINDTPKETNQMSNDMITVEELNSQLAQQPIFIVDTEYVIQDDNFKTLYPDLLTVSIKNNTDQDIKNVVVSFVAWDENNLPVKIEGQFDFSDTTYVKKVNFSDINLVAGGTFGEKSVSFVAWDENNLPVKIEGQFDFSDTTYVKKVNFSDINLVAGGTFGEKSGLALSENSKIKTFKAIVESYETFDGTTWKNPYYDEFCTLYEGKKLIES